MSSRIEGPRQTRTQSTQEPDRRVIDRPKSPDGQQQGYMRDSYSRNDVAGQTQRSGADLQNSPQFKNAYATANANDRRLLDELKNHPNASSAFDAYQGLRGGPQNPSRLNDAMVRDLTLGVATSADPGQAATPGVLSPGHVQNTRDALLGMPQQQFDQFASTYQNAGNPDASVERQLLLKSVGARSASFRGANPEQAAQAMGEVVQFGQAVRGLDSKTLLEQTTVQETQRSLGYAQMHKGTCQTATMIGLKAKNDPILAMQVRHSTPEQNKALEEKLLRDNGFTAEQLQKGLLPEEITRLNNNAGVNDRLEYSTVNVDPSNASGYLNQAASALSRGWGVPFGINFTMDGKTKGHNLSLQAVSGKPGDRMFQIHDTGTGGKTRWVPEKDLLDGSFAQKQFGYPSAYSDFRLVSFNLPRSKVVADAQRLGMVSQEDTDKGLLNVKAERNQQSTVQDTASADKKQYEEEAATRRKPNKDLDDDGIPLDDGFGVSDDL